MDTVTIKGCLAWEQVTLVNTDLCQQTQEWASFVTDNISPDTLKFYGGMHATDDYGAEHLGLSDNKGRTFFAVYSLLSAILEPSGGCLISSELFQKGLYKIATHHADTYLAICFYTVGALRLQGIDVHARVDDTGLGYRPVTDDLVDAQEQIKRWLQRRWGELLPGMLNKVAIWNPSVQFYTHINRDDDNLILGDKSLHFPSLRELLPYAKSIELT